MDNLTHSLIGIALAESVYHQTPAALKRGSASLRLRAGFWVAAVVGSNLPDLDLLYANLFLSGRLGYLLHHRGHTHTLLFALLQGVILGALVLRWVRGKKPRKKLPVFEQRALWGVALAAPTLHIAFDGLNNYGVHPFWPVWNGWMYGDSVFILEPLLWVALFPVVFFLTQRRAVRWVVETSLVALFTALWILPISRWYTLLIVLGMGAGMFTACRRAKPGWRATFSLTTAALVVLGFSMLSIIARKRLENHNALLHPGAKLHDVVLSPFPANPLCWSVVTIETYLDPAKTKRYRLRRGTFAPFPSLAVAAQCPRFPSKGSTAYLATVPDLWGPEFQWEGQYQAAVSDLTSYREYSCVWSDFLRFARAPFLQEEGGSLWAGDLRFDYGPELGFAELEVPDAPGPCGGWVPPWIPPRADLF